MPDSHVLLFGTCDTFAGYMCTAEFEPSRESDHLLGKGYSRPAATHVDSRIHLQEARESDVTLRLGIERRDYDNVL